MIHLLDVALKINHRSNLLSRLYPRRAHVSKLR